MGGTQFFEANIDAYLGHMSKDDLMRARKLAGNARTIEEKLKRQYDLKK